MRGDYILLLLLDKNNSSPFNVNRDTLKAVKRILILFCPAKPTEKWHFTLINLVKVKSELFTWTTFEI